MHFLPWLRVLATWAAHTVSFDLLAKVLLAFQPEQAELVTSTLDEFLPLPFAWQNPLRTERTEQNTLWLLLTRTGGAPGLVSLSST